jgi:hypothetical protein
MKRKILARISKPARLLFRNRAIRPEKDLDDKFNSDLNKLNDSTRKIANGRAEAVRSWQSGQNEAGWRI